MVTRVESALMDYCCDALNLQSLNGQSESNKDLAARLSRMQFHLAELENQSERMLVIALDSGNLPESWRRKGFEIENEMRILKKQIQSTSAAMMTSASQTDEKIAEVFKELRDGVIHQLEAPRMKVRSLLSDTFQKIVIYKFGVNPTNVRGHNKRDPFEMMLVSKTGISRLLLINRDGSVEIRQVDEEKIPTEDGSEIEEEVALAL